MKKIKGLLFAFVALFAFTIAMVKVSAAGDTYSILPDDFYAGATKTTGTASADKQAPTVTTVTKGGVVSITIPTSSNCYCDFGTLYAASNSTGETFSSELVCGGSRNIEVTLTLTASQSAYIDVYWYAKDNSKTLTVGSTSVSTASDTRQKVLLSTSEKITSGTSMPVAITTTTNTVLLRIDVRVETSSESIETQAIAAINAIGTVEYTQACFSKIQTAKALVEASSDQSAITNLSTYEAALEAFNTAKDAAVAAFVDGVTNLVVSENSYSDVVALKGLYKALLAAEKGTETVANAYSELCNKEDEVYQAAYNGLAKKFVPTQAMVGDITSKEILNNSIFIVNGGEHSVVSIDSSNAGYRLKLGGTGVKIGDEIKEGTEVVEIAARNYRTVEFYTKGSGVLKVSAMSSSSSADRTLNLYSDSLEGTALHSFEAKGSEVSAGDYRITSAGHYFLASPESGVNIYSLEFVADPEPSANAYFDSGYNAAGTELIRGIIVCENMTETQLAQQLTGTKVAISGEGLPQEGFDITSYIQIGDSITSNGEVYSFTDEDKTITCGAQTNVKYAIVVVAVSNDGAGLAEEYVGKELTITVSSADGHETYYSWTYTVQGAQQ